MIDFSRRITDNSLNEQLADNIKSSINTMIICKVIKFYKATQTVDLQPVITKKIIDSNSKTIEYSRLGEPLRITEVEQAPILGVPLCYPRSGQYMITLPIQVDDTGMLIVAQRDITNWKQKGGVQKAALNNLFDLNSAVFLPFVPNKVNNIADYNDAALEIRANSTKISMDGSKIDITGDVNITGTLTATVDVVGSGKSLKNHTHPAQGSLKDGNNLNVSGSTGSPS